MSSYLANWISQIQKVFVDFDLVDDAKLPLRHMVGSQNGKDSILSKLNDGESVMPWESLSPKAMLTTVKAPPSDRIPRSGPHLPYVILGEWKTFVGCLALHEEPHHFYQGLNFDVHAEANGENFTGLPTDEFDEVPIRR